MDLIKKWKLLESQGADSGLKTIRFEADSPLEIFLAVDSKALRSILIYLPSSYEPRFENLDNDNLELTFIKEGHFLQIRLLDPEFLLLFDDLVFSLLESIKEIKDTLDASKAFMATYIKWNMFFKKTSEKKLSKERVMGLWGELNYLLSLIKEKRSYTPINKILKYWFGPYDAAHDFELPNRSLELKTKLFGSSTIKISSEFQLEKTDNKSLHLAVLSIIESEDGLSINDLFLSLKEIILKNGGDITLLLTALEKESLSEERLMKYSSSKFFKKNLEIFDCELSDFPKISLSNLPEAISTVKYNLDVKSLIDYRIYEEIF